MSSGEGAWLQVEWLSLFGEANAMLCHKVHLAASCPCLHYDDMRIKAVSKSSVPEHVVIGLKACSRASHHGA